MRKFTLYQNLSTLVKALFTLLYITYAVNVLQTEEERAISMALVSLTGVSIIFDLGLSQVFINWASSQNGKVKVQTVITSWYILSSILTMAASAVIGSIVFYKYNIKIWLAPHIAMVLAMTLNIYLSSLIIIHESLGEIEKAYWKKMISSVGLIAGGITAYILDAGLYFLAVSYLASSVVLLHGQHKLIFDKDELWNFFRTSGDFIKKTSIVWISGFLFWHSPVLISAKYVSFGEASEFAITFSILNSINFFALSVITPYRSILTDKLKAVNQDSAQQLFVGLLFKVIALWIVSQIGLILFYELPWYLSVKYKNSTFDGLMYLILLMVMLFNFLLQIGSLYLRCAGVELFHRQLVFLNFITPCVFILSAFKFKFVNVMSIWLFIMLLVLISCVMKYRQYVKMNSLYRNNFT